MNFKKRLLTLLCALALLAGVAAAALAASTNTTVYLLAINDKMADLPGGVRPLSLSGVIYVPYTAFDRAATGADLEVYYGIDRSQGLTLSLYNSNSMLLFRVYNTSCEDGQGNSMDFHAIRRNGIPYVPAAAVCAYFGLNYACLPTRDRGTLIRITNDATTMTDAVFLDLARQRMLDRYNNIVQTVTPPPTPTPVPTSPSVPTPPPITPAPGAKEKVAVRLALDVSGLRDATWLELSDNVPLLILFAPDELADRSEQVRRAVAAGFSIGLKTQGSMEEALADLERGNELLSHIARIRTRIVAAPAELVGGLTQAGWVCWQSNVSGTTVNAILTNLERQKVPARLTLPGGTAAERAIRRLARNEDYIFHRTLEADLGEGA